MNTSTEYIRKQMKATEILMTGPLMTCFLSLIIPNGTVPNETFPL